MKLAARGRSPRLPRYQDEDSSFICMRTMPRRRCTMGWWTCGGDDRLPGRLEAARASGRRRQRAAAGRDRHHPAGRRRRRARPAGRAGLGPGGRPARDRGRQRGSAARRGSGIRHRGRGRAPAARGDRPARRPAGAAEAGDALPGAELRRSSHPLRQGRSGRPRGRAPRRDTQDRAHLPRFSVPRVPVGAASPGLPVDRAAAGPDHRRGAVRGRRGGRRGGPAGAGRAGTDPHDRRGRGRPGPGQGQHERPAAGGSPPRPCHAGPSGRRRRGRRGGPADLPEGLPEGARGFRRGDAGAGPAGGNRRLGGRR